MSRIEAWLDETPGETRGVIARDGVFEQLLIQRDDDVAEHRLGARVAGRIGKVEPGLSGAFVDLGSGVAQGLLPLKGADKAVEGARIEVEVTAEPRGGKGPSLRRIGATTAEPGLIADGPSVVEQLAVLAPGVEAVRGAGAVQAALEAEEEALESGWLFRDTGLDLKIERTRGLIAVDFDLTPGVKATRARANAQGLAATARALALKAWGGLVVIDLIGGAQDGEAVLKAARAAFRTPGVVFGPVSKLGVFHLSLPWRRTPVEERLELGTERGQAQAVVRRLNHALLTRTGVARVTAVCAPDVAARAAGWVRELGPRAAVRGEAGLAPGVVRIEEG